MTSCSRAGPRPNIVLVLVDTLRADHTSLHGYRRETTPNLERIAGEGLVLRSHLANAPWTKPSIASLITGLHPTAHGSRTGQFEKLKRIQEIRRQGGNPNIEILSSRHRTLAEVLQQVGYQTSALIANAHLTPKFGYSQGYDHYRYDPGLFDRDAVDATMDLLRRAEGPAFVWCHMMAVHAYYSPAGHKRFSPEAQTPIDTSARQYEHMQRHGYEFLESAIADYDNSIVFADALIGELFDSILREEPNTVLIVTSDHGEEFYEHGGFEHVSTLYNELLHVPFIAWGPGVPHGEIQGLTDSIDVLPTLMHLLEIEPAAELPGSVLFDGDHLSRGKREVFAEKHHRDRHKRFALFQDDGKFIVNRHKRTGEEHVELYAEVLGDEIENVAAGVDPAELQALRDRVAAWESQLIARFESVVEERSLADLSDQDIEQLKALGYVN